jgi:hypothetical protein
VIDIVRDDLLIEIQTGNFSSIKSKLLRLVRDHRVRLIHPIVQEKWIVRRAAGQRGADARRKSPRKGRLEDLFWEMVSLPQLISDRNFSLEVVMIRAEEVRRYDRRRGWRRKGWVTDARYLLEVVDRRVFDGAADWLACLPAGCDVFTTGDLASAMNSRVALAQKMAYCLREGKLIEMIGRRGRANLYRVAGPRESSSPPHGLVHRLLAGPSRCTDQPVELLGES